MSPDRDPKQSAVLASVPTDAAEATETRPVFPSPPGASPSPSPDRATDGGMETGTGADDEPELAIGDREYEGDDLRISPTEAKRLLGEAQK